VDTFEAVAFRISTPAIVVGVEGVPAHQCYPFLFFPDRRMLSTQARRGEVRVE
jgi:hypothetical protein